MANIVEGIPNGYPSDGIPAQSARPLPFSGIPIGATNVNELLTADYGERELLVLQVQLLYAILVELRLNNEKSFPDVNWDNERDSTGAPLADDIANLPIG